MTRTDEALSPEREATLDVLVRAARIRADSYTLSRADARWVAREAMHRSSESPHAITRDLHARLWKRRVWYPSAREVYAIVLAALAKVEATGHE